MEVDGGRFIFVGLDMFRALRYKPQALQMVEPAGDRRQSGVWVVPQLLSSLVSDVGFRAQLRRVYGCDPLGSPAYLPHGDRDIDWAILFLQLTLL